MSLCRYFYIVLLVCVSHSLLASDALHSCQLYRVGHDSMAKATLTAKFATAMTSEVGTDMTYLVSVASLVQHVKAKDYGCIVVPAVRRCMYDSKEDKYITKEEAPAKTLQDCIACYLEYLRQQLKSSGRLPSDIESGSISVLKRALVRMNHARLLQELTARIPVQV